MKITVRCPASCGELIEGTIGGRQMLISYPINLYSQVTVEKRKGGGKQPGYHKLYQGVELFLTTIGEKPFLDHVQITVGCSIPRGKGMASSTADLAGGIKGVAELIGYSLTEAELVSLLIAIEPTDSTIFSSLTLFDYLEGQYWECLGDVPPFQVLVLEGWGEVDTVGLYRSIKQDRLDLSLDQAYQQVVQGMKNRDWGLLGQGAITSARQNQRLLYKPYLEPLIALAMKYNALGVNVAHSGTVVGVIHDGGFPIDKFMWEIKRNPKLYKYFIRMYPARTVPGGVEFI